MASNTVTVLADAPTVVAVPAAVESSQAEREELPASAQLRYNSEDISELPEEAAA